MAGRGWGGSVLTAVGVAAGVGAAQLGFGYGLGIINWAPVDTGAIEPSWFASLAWATWIAAVSTVAGAVCAQRLHERGADAEAGGTLHRVTLAVAGAVGALITVLLVAVPSRAASVPDTFSPQTVAAGYAGVGVLMGLVVTVWTLHSRAAATNVIATVGWLWLLAVVSVVDGVLAGRGLTSAQLGIWQIAQDSPRFWLRDHLYWPGALLALGSALLIGALAARRAARTAELRLGAVVSGAAGPLLVAVAYFLAVPRLATISPAQVSAHLVAPYAVIVGAAGSVLVASLAQRAERRAAARTTAPVPHPRTGELDDRPAGTDPVPPSDPDARANLGVPADPHARADPDTRADVDTRADMGARADPDTRADVDTRANPDARADVDAGARADMDARADLPATPTDASGGEPTPSAVGRARPVRRGRAAPTAASTSGPSAGGPSAGSAPDQSTGSPTGLPTDPPAVPRPRSGRRTP
ncbi:hypothetical protein ACQP1S_00295 [Micromonospora matsumotoense]|uniref:hypothetical protein n=1 Tax=Micromonospora matsumotoense TaxID=121616 RepID=UPI003D8E5829